MKGTSRDSRSSLATAIGVPLPCRRASASAALSGAAVERVSALARLDLRQLGGDGEALGLGEAGDGGALGVEPEAGAALLAGRDPVVGDERFH